MQKRKFIKATTPIGTAVYPRLNSPDTKFNKDGVYSVDLQLDPSDKDTTTFITSLKKASDDAYKAECENRGGKKLKRSELPIKETDEGMIRIKFKLNAKAGNEEKSWAQKPMLFDAQGNAMATPPNIGSGSTIRVSFEIVPYFTAMVGAGVSLRMKAVQIIDLREYTPGDNFDAYGFKATDGFVVSAQTETTTSSETMDDESDF